MKAFEIGKQYELVVKNVTQEKGKRYTLHVYDKKDNKRCFSIPVDSSQLKMPVTALKHQTIVADYLPVEGKAEGKGHWRLAKEFFKDGVMEEPPVVVSPSDVKETGATVEDVPKSSDDVTDAVAGAASLSDGDAGMVQEKDSTSSDGGIAPAGEETAETAGTHEVSKPAIPAEEAALPQTSAGENIPVYETGKEYELKVFYVYPSGNCLDVTAGPMLFIPVSVTGELLKPLRYFDNKKVTVICNGYEKGHPVFTLAPKYFKGEVVVDSMEGLDIEFKQSMIFSPDTHAADCSQPFQIAKEICAFMNTKGGKLYLGIDDSGRLTGIESDFDSLDNAPVIINDKVQDPFSYKASKDGFDQKLHNIVRYYLGALTNELLENTEFITEATLGLTYAVVTVKPSPDDVIYLNDQIAIRCGSSSVILKGRERDKFVVQRALRRIETHYQESLNTFKGTMESREAEIEALKHLLTDIRTEQASQPKIIATQKLESGFILLNDPKFLEAEIVPKGIAYKPNTAEYRMEAATKWVDCYVALLKILSALDPEKFDGLPDAKEVQPLRGKGKNFARRGTNVHLKNASEYLGSKNDIRAEVAGISRASFVTDKTVIKRVIDYFGVQLSDLAVLV